MSYIVPRDKPKRCTRPKCRFMDRDTLDCRLQGKSWESFEEQYEHCPLIEVPAPHGRLIDADELANKTFYSTTSAPYITYKTFCDAPTVIEAERDET